MWRFVKVLNTGFISLDYVDPFDWAKGCVIDNDLVHRVGRVTIPREQFHIIGEVCD